MYTLEERLDQAEAKISFPSVRIKGSATKSGTIYSIMLPNMK